MGLVLDVLIATFVGDTCAYFVGRSYGRSPIAPLISPNKTLEGLVGGIVGGTLAFWLAGLYQDWLSGGDALLIGFLVAITAPIGDLFESMIKRDLEVKDTGTLFGAHGGVLDRLDAVLFTIVVGYYAAVGLGYGRRAKSGMLSLNVTAGSVATPGATLAELSRTRTVQREGGFPLP